MKPLTLVILLGLYFSIVKPVNSSFPFGVFPLLTSGWYYKPSAEESVVLGLIVVKVLAIRLAAILGFLPIPYHLNDLFLKRSFVKRSVSTITHTENLTLPHNSDFTLQESSFYNSKENVTVEELTTIFRIFLALRRIDVNDCFLKSLCLMSYRTSITETSLQDPWDTRVLNLIRYLIEMERRKALKEGKSSVMDVYEKALITGKHGKENACKATYFSCPLSERALQDESIITEYI